MLSLYKINPNNTKKRTKKVENTNSNNNSQLNHDVERPQLTSNDFKPTQTKFNKKKQKCSKSRICATEY